MEIMTWAAGKVDILHLLHSMWTTNRSVIHVLLLVQLLHLLVSQLCFFFSAGYKIFNVRWCVCNLYSLWWGLIHISCHLVVVSLYTSLARSFSQCHQFCWNMRNEKINCSLKRAQNKPMSLVTHPLNVYLQVGGRGSCWSTFPSWIPEQDLKSGKYLPIFFSFAYTKQLSQKLNIVDLNLQGCEKVSQVLTE